MKEKILKHKKWVLVGAGLLVIAAVIGIISHNMMQVSKAESLEAISSEPESDNILEAWGEVKVEKIYDISIDFPSIVTDIKVKEGDRVSLGQELVTLDMSEYLGTMEKLQQQLAAGQAGLQDIVQDSSALSADIAQLEKDITTKTQELNKGTNADVKMLQNSLRLAKKEAETAKRDVINNQTLYDVGSVPQNVLDQYIEILDQREKAISDIETNLEKTKSSLKTELNQLDISLKSKKAQLEQIKNSNGANTVKQNSSVAVAQVDLDIMESKSVKNYLGLNRIISSVKNGIVQNISVINGTRLGVQNTPTMVLQLIDADSIVVSAEVDEEFIKNVTLGGTVKIVPVSDNSLSIPGIVTQISNLAVEKDGKRIIRVEIKPQDPEGELKPGYSTDVYFPKE